MTTLALISVGALTGALLELTGKVPAPRSYRCCITHTAAGEASQQLRLESITQGYYPEIAAVELDMAIEAPEQLANMRADGFVRRRRCYRWVKEGLAARRSARRTVCNSIACHLAPMQGFVMPVAFSPGAQPPRQLQPRRLDTVTPSLPACMPHQGNGNVAAIPQTCMAMASVHEAHTHRGAARPSRNTHSSTSALQRKSTRTRRSSSPMSSVWGQTTPSSSNSPTRLKSNSERVGRNMLLMPLFAPRQVTSRR